MVEGSIQCLASPQTLRGPCTPGHQALGGAHHLLGGERLKMGQIKEAAVDKATTHSYEFMPFDQNGGLSLFHHAVLQFLTHYPDKKSQLDQGQTK